MKKNCEIGFATIELIVGIALISLIALGSSMVTQQTIAINDSTQANITAVVQVGNAGYWLTRDAQMAEGITTDELTSPDFIIITWTEWVLDTDSIYHSATYYFEDLTDGIGKLMRHHWTSAGANETSLVGEYIYYNPSDPDNTSMATYTNPTLTVRLVATCEDTTEQREYKIIRRPDFNW
ncbi:MAG: hypothetical protein PHY28_02595 [Dehalococcoidales bacterium]|nr:hypothetical protein [Dehalococcoidales bacterium]